MSDMNNPSDENTGALDDLWADALNEQKTTTSKSAADAVFQQLGGGDVSGTLQDIDLIMDIPVKLTVELGRTRMTIKELSRNRAIEASSCVPPQLQRIRRILFVME